LENDGRELSLPEILQSIDLSQGKLVPSGSPFDFAIAGPGFLRLRDGEEIVYSRGGSFSIGADGALTDPGGRRLQSTSGGDITVESPELEILGDGTVLERGLPVAAIALVEAGHSDAIEAVGGSLFRISEGAVREADTSTLRQGFLEQANVTTSDEMISMMAALRQAESGSRLVRTYDQLIGQAITTFSRRGQ
jgi:flagellar basal body rod protein FlgG